MPYLYDTFEGNETIRKELKGMYSMKPKFAEEDLEKAEKMEFHASKFTDPGGDFMEIRLFDSEGNVITTKRTEGY